MSLLDQALAIGARKSKGHKRNLDPCEAVELALAWFRGDISETQVATVLEVGVGTGARSMLLSAIREGVSKGVVRLEVSK